MNAVEVSEPARPVLNGNWLSSLDRIVQAADRTKSMYCFNTVVPKHSPLRNTQPAQPLQQPRQHQGFLRWRARVALMQDMYDQLLETPLDLASATFPALLEALNLMDQAAEPIVKGHGRYFKVTYDEGDRPIQRCEQLHDMLQKAELEITKDATSRRMLRPHKWEQLPVCEKVRHAALVMSATNTAPVDSRGHLFCCR